MRRSCNGTADRSRCRIETAYTAITDKNAVDLLGNCDLILDGTDNRRTRQILNRVSVRRRVPFIYGGISGWEGTASTFVPGSGPCFGCVLPPRTESAGTVPPPVLGPTAGLVASIQCLEALRFLIGAPPRLVGKMLQVSGSTMKFRTLRIDRNPQCPICRGLKA